MPSSISFRGARVLVTGGRGFIGRHLVLALREQGALVTTLDRSDAAARLRRADHVRADVRAPEARAAVERADLVVHLAGSGDVERSRREPLRFHETIVGGTLSVLSAARPGATVVLPSTQRIYRPATRPIPESARPRPTDPYALFKLQAELLCAYFAREAGLRTRVARLFSVYGPDQAGQGSSGVVAIFLARAQAGQPIQAMPGPRRDFTYVADATAGLLALLQPGEPSHRVYNLATGVPTALDELAEAVLAATGRRVPIERLPRGEPRGGDAPPRGDLVADISRARRELGYAPRYGLEEGLRLTVEGGRVGE